MFTLLTRRYGFEEVCDYTVDVFSVNIVFSVKIYWLKQGEFF